MTYARIAGVGSCLPEKVLTNKDLEGMMDTSDEWIRERTGMKRRHVAGEGETTGSMSLIAAQRALEMAGMEADELDMIVVGTCTPDKIIPATATIVQRELGIKGCPALDVNAACSGFIYALELANGLIKSGAHTKILVIGVEKISMCVRL